mgnify:CR=1 FL=1
MLVLLATLGLAADLDADGVDDALDNCVYIANPNQSDTNADGYGDACAHPTASVGADVIIARGGYIDAGATVGSGVLVVRGTVGAGAQVGNDAVVYGSIAAETPSSGPAIVGTGAVLGHRGTIAPGARIGDHAVIYGPVGTRAVVGDRSIIGRGGELAPLVQVGSDTWLRATVGLSSSIGDRVAIGRAVLGRRVTVHDGVRIGTFVTIGDDAVIGDGARLRWSVTVGDDAQIGADASLAHDAVIGADAIVGQDARVGRNGTVPAGSVLPADAVLVEGQPLAQAEVCTDSLDNDADGAADCMDDDCEPHPACRSESDCSDGLDDDLDGLVDCEDVDCRVLGACPGEVDCADGQDNDGDFREDCRDSDCWGGPDCQVETDCTDRRDNDLDGWVDAYDPDCGPHPESCRDPRGWSDSDLDGLVSRRDPDCVPVVASEADCRDGFDNDGNGLIDCEDAGCATDTSCAEDCLDGIDNDGDGERDCDDIDCAGLPCLVERRVTDGTVLAWSERNHWRDTPFGVNVRGEACLGSNGLHAYAYQTASFRIDMQVEATLRIPNASGPSSSITCAGEVMGAGMAFVGVREYRAADVPMRTLPVRRVDQTKEGRVQASDECSHPDLAREAMLMRIDPRASLVLGSDGVPDAMPTLGSWNVGVPAYWLGADVTSSYLRPRPSNSGCERITVHANRDLEAEWALPAQTHTISSP